MQGVAAAEHLGLHDIFDIFAGCVFFSCCVCTCLHVVESCQSILLLGHKVGGSWRICLPVLWAQVTWTISTQENPLLHSLGLTFYQPALNHITSHTHGYIYIYTCIYILYIAEGRCSSRHKCMHRYIRMMYISYHELITYIHLFVSS